MLMNENNIVKLTLDLKNPPHLTTEQKDRMDAVAAMPDSQIDYSDAPSLPNAVWVKVTDAPCAKQQITLRIDSDVLDFFRNTGKRYQTRINAVLRSYMISIRQSPLNTEPNEFSLVAIREIDEGKGIQYSSAEALFDDLGNL